MVFFSVAFFQFLVTLLVLLAVLPKRWRKPFLLAASYYFYAYWDYRFTLLILTSTVVDYFIGPAIYRSQDGRRKRLLLLASVCVNLGLLGFFKYYNFFVDSASAVLSEWGLGISNLEIILPVGISFYTFQTMSYTLDIYRGKLKPARSFSDFALFVAFFPQLVAGPIVRAADFLPQLEHRVHIRGANLWAGTQIFLIGLFKKLMIADSVAPFVDAVHEYPGYYSPMTTWLCVLAYSLQIYCDFSGYSDMATGCARMMGYEFQRNFNMPYLSATITEFWRRWHISLSSWLRDYLYISLGGNRKGHLRTYTNLLTAMILGGLWHGASWNFVIWGTLHGAVLALHKAWTGMPKPAFWNSGLIRVLGVASTFMFVSLVWVLFRAQDTQTMEAVYRKLLFLDAYGAS